MSTSCVSSLCSSFLPLSRRRNFISDLVDIILVDDSLSRIVDKLLRLLVVRLFFEWILFFNRAICACCLNTKFNKIIMPVVVIKMTTACMYNKDMSSRRLKCILVNNKCNIKCIQALAESLLVNFTADALSEDFGVVIVTGGLISAVVAVDGADFLMHGSSVGCVVVGDLVNKAGLCICLLVVVDTGSSVAVCTGSSCDVVCTGGLGDAEDVRAGILVVTTGAAVDVDVIVEDACAGILVVTTGAAVAVDVIVVVA